MRDINQRIGVGAGTHVPLGPGSTLNPKDSKGWCYPLYQVSSPHPSSRPQVFLDILTWEELSLQPRSEPKSPHLPTTAG